MAALAADRMTTRRSGVDFSFPVAAATKIFAGAQVAINATNSLVPGAVSTTLQAVGVAIEQADNSAGAADAINCKVQRGVWKMANSAAGDLIERNDIGKQCYIVDDQTVALTSNGATRSVAGVIRDVDASGVWVEY